MEIYPFVVQCCKAIFSNQKSLAFEDLIEPIFGHPKQVGKMGISAHSHFGYILRALIILTSIHSFVCKSEYENYINEHEQVFFNTRKRSESACAVNRDN